MSTPTAEQPTLEHRVQALTEQGLVLVGELANMQQRIAALEQADGMAAAGLYKIGGTGGTEGGATPTGPAGGQLAGSYPNPTLATNVTVPAATWTIENKIVSNACNIKDAELTELLEIGVEGEGLCSLSLPAVGAKAAIKLTKSEDNYVLPNGYMYRIEGTGGEWTITGLVPEIYITSFNLEVRLINVGTEAIKFGNEEKSTAKNRLLCKGKATKTLAANEQIKFWYDEHVKLWREIS